VSALSVALRDSKPCANRNPLKTQGKTGGNAACRGEVGESGDFGESGNSAEASVELEFVFVDFQGLNSVIKGRRWDSELGRCS